LLKNTHLSVLTEENGMVFKVPGKILIQVKK